MAPMHGPTYGPGPIPFMAIAHGHGAFRSWPWRIPFMAIALFHSWPRPPFMAKVLSLSHRITTPGKPSPYIRYRMAQASPPRRFRVNRSNPGIKVTGVGGSSGGSLPSIGAIIEHHIYAYVKAINGGMRASMGARMAIYTHIYGSSNGHVCAYLWQQQWPCMRISMGQVCAYLWAMNAHIYGSSNGHECAYLWAMYARISMGVM